MTNSKSIVRHLKQKRLQLVPAIGLMILATVGYLNAPKNVQPYLFGAYTLALGFGFGMPSNRLIKAVEEDLQDYEHEIISHFETRLKSAETALKSASEGKESAGTAIAKLQSDLNAANVKNNELAATARAALTKLETLKADSAKIIQTAKQQTKTSVDAAKAEAEAQVKKATEALKIHFAETLERRVLEGREELEKQEYAKSLARIKKYRTEHKQRELQLYTALTQSETEKEGLELQFNQRVQEVASKYDDLISNYEAALSSYHPELQTIKETFTQQLSSVVEERDRLYTQLQQYHAPKSFTGSSKADINGNKLLSFYMGRNIVLDADRCVSHPNFDEIWVRPRNATPDDLKSHSDELHLAFEILEAPKVEIDRGSIKFTLIQLKENQKPVIKDPGQDWLMDVVRESNHYRIAAPTDSGKSVLMDNIINAQRIVDGANLVVSLADPKYPFNEWIGLTPKFKGFEECLNAAVEIGNEVDRRLELATQAKNNGKEIPDFDARLIVFDELEALHDDARNGDGGKKGKLVNELVSNLRKGLKLGRGLTKTKGKGLKLAYITQSPLASRISLNKDDFDQSTNIWIGDTIARALTEELDGKISTAEMADLRKQFDLRKDSGEDYFCLVKTPKRAFLAPMPAPGFYAKKLNSELPPTPVAATKTATLSPVLEGVSHPTQTPIIQSTTILESSFTNQYTVLVDDVEGVEQPQKPEKTEEIIHCPKCGSTTLTGNGMRNGKKRYRCKDCNKTFSS